ncbi:MAG: Cohesin domain protein, partial [Oscillospiraceae bacterium]|nr:Cohesin domain protein [Oscillospiraceae bacterium]
GGDKFLYGDSNCDGTVDVSNAVLLSRYLAEDSGAKIDAQGKLNSNCDGNSELDSDDVLRILKLIAKLVTPDQMGKVI